MYIYRCISIQVCIHVFIYIYIRTPFSGDHEESTLKIRFILQKNPAKTGHFFQQSLSY